MELKLEDKAALVTGASRGIGAASAKALAHHGATVIINYLNSKDKAEGLLDDVKKSGGNGMVFQADVRDQGAVNDMVGSTLKEFRKIDVLVNNANINFPISPAIQVLRYGGSFPWEKNPDEAYICCPDHLNRTVFKLERSGEVVIKNDKLKFCLGA